MGTSFNNMHAMIHLLMFASLLATLSLASTESANRIVPEIVELETEADAVVAEGKATYEFVSATESTGLASGSGVAPTPTLANILATGIRMMATAKPTATSMNTRDTPQTRHAVAVAEAPLVALLKRCFMSSSPQPNQPRVVPAALELPQLQLLRQLPQFQLKSQHIVSMEVRSPLLDRLPGQQLSQHQLQHQLRHQLESART